MTTYTIKPGRADELTSDPENHVFTLEEIMTDAANFKIPLAEYITEYLDVHQDNPMDAEQLLEYADRLGMDTVSQYMDDTIRAYLDNQLAPCTEREFIEAYLQMADLVIN